MDIAHLRYFKNLIECESYSKAARASYVTQPALSAAIRSLEKELGFSLIDRTKASVEPTEAGRKFYSTVSIALDEIDRTIADCRSETAQKSVVTVGLDPCTLGSTITSLLREAISQILPEVDIRFRQTDEPQLLSELKGRRIDIALIAQQTTDDAVTLAKVLPCQLAACVSPNSEFARVPTLTVADLINKNLLACSSSSPMGRRIAPWVERHRLNAIFDFEDEATLVSVVKVHERSIGLVPIPSNIPISKSGPRLIPIEDPGGSFFVYAAQNQGAPLGCDASRLKSRLAAKYVNSQPQTPSPSNDA